MIIPTSGINGVLLFTVGVVGEENLSLHVIMVVYPALTSWEDLVLRRISSKSFSFASNKWWCLLHVGTSSVQTN